MWHRAVPWTFCCSSAIGVPQRQAGAAHPGHSTPWAAPGQILALDTASLGIISSWRVVKHCKGLPMGQLCIGTIPVRHRRDPGLGAFAPLSFPLLQPHPCCSALRKPGRDPRWGAG